MTSAPHDSAAAPSARPPIAVVGAGVAGLALARTLADAGIAVRLFDKGRAAGGRVATRRAAPWAFDHGAQFFTARDERFAQVVAEAERRGRVARWNGPFATRRGGEVGGDPRPDAVRFVGTPGMSALSRALADGLDVIAETRVHAIERRGDGWWLRSQHGEHGPFREVALTLPPAQVLELLGPALASSAVGFAAAALLESLRPCLCAMVAFAAPVAAAAGGWFLTDEVLGWVAHDGGKPGRGETPTYVLHAGAAWSERHWDRPEAEWTAELLAAFARVFGPALPEVVHLGGHRWRYALAADVERPGPFVHDAHLGLSLCGDSLVGGRVEGAFTSGADLGYYLVASGR